MTSFLRFFILALTPLLAVSVSFGPAVMFGLVATMVLTAVAAMVFFLRGTIKESALIWSILGLGVLLITLVDLVFTLWMPSTRHIWGLYLNLLAFSPLVVILPLEKPQTDLGEGLSLALKTGLVLTGLFALASLVRESLGHGTITLVPGLLEWSLPILKDFPLTILATGAGGFFLAALGVVAYRSLRPRLPRMDDGNDSSAPGQGGNETTTSDIAPPTGPEPVLESTEEWGEDLTAVVASLASTGNGNRRLLVIGSGNGELAYYLSMLCLEQAKGSSFEFRVRGVDHFASRIETAVKGVYRDHDLNGVPTPIRDAWMTRGQGEDRLWRVNNEPRLHVQFEVADFQQGPLFYSQPCHLIVLNQGIEYVSDDKKVQLLKTVYDNLLPGAALVARVPFRRDFLPEGMKRTGTTVFRKP